MTICSVNYFSTRGIILAASMAQELYSEMNNYVTKLFFPLETNYSGLTGQVEFDTSGTRSNVEIDVMILTVDGLNKTGSFKPTNTERLSFLPQNNEDSNSDELPINQKTFKVIISVVSSAKSLN